MEITMERDVFFELGYSLLYNHVSEIPLPRFS